MKLPDWLRHPRSWLDEPIKADADGDVWSDPRLTAAGAWAGAGFTALTALLAFFGLQDDRLHEILHANPTASLWVLCLVGLALVCSLLSPAFDPQTKVPLGWVLAAGTALMVVSWALYPKLRQSDFTFAHWRDFDFAYTDGVALGVLVVMAGAFWLWRTNRLPVTAALILVAVLAMTLGLFGAAKVAVYADSLSASPSLVASVAAADGKPVVRVVVSAGKRDGLPLVVMARGTPRGSSEDGPSALLGEQVLVADVGGSIDETVSFPFDPAEWTTVSVGYCDNVGCHSQKGSAPGCADPADDDGADKPDSDDSDEPQASGGPSGAGAQPVARPAPGGYRECARLPTLSSPEAQVHAVVSVSATRTAVVDVTVAGMPPGTTTVVQVARTGKNRRLVALRTVLVPDAAGAARLDKAQVPVQRGDTVAVTYRRCTTRPAGCDPAAPEAARVTVG